MPGTQRAGTGGQPYSQAGKRRGHRNSAPQAQLTKQALEVVLPILASTVVEVVGQRRHPLEAGAVIAAAQLMCLYPIRAKYDLGGAGSTRDQQARQKYSRVSLLLAFSVCCYARAGKQSVAITSSTLVQITGRFHGKDQANVGW